MTYWDAGADKVVEKVCIFGSHRGAMNALKRQLMVFWRGRPPVEVYRIGVNSVRAPLWGVMSFVVEEGNGGNFDPIGIGLQIANGGGALAKV